MPQRDIRGPNIWRRLIFVEKTELPIDECKSNNDRAGPMRRRSSGFSVTVVNSAGVIWELHRASQVQ